MEEINAPLSELRLASQLRRYEKLKMWLLVVILIVVLVTGVYLVALSNSNHESLVILRCAVDKAVQFDSHGHVRTALDQRHAFDACISHGSPVFP